MKSTHELKTLSMPLIHIISNINNQDDAFNFLRDLLTEPELIEFNQRLIIAYMLSNKISYKKIEEETWASSTTIARVSKFLKWKNTNWWYQKFIGLLK